MKLSVERVLAWVASIVVLIVCGVALVLMESPGVARERKLDDRRITDLKRLDTAINVQARRDNALPGDLANLDAAPWLEVATDPETGEPYGYERIDDTRYRICADFSAKSRSALHPQRAVEWMHPAGRHCFDRERRKDPEN